MDRKAKLTVVKQTTTNVYLKRLMYKCA